MQEPQKPILLNILHVALIIVGFLLIGSFVVSIYNLWRRGDVIEEREAYLKRLEQEQVELKNQLSYTLTQDFIEEEARNKLNMIRPGETLVVLPQTSSPSAENTITTQVANEPEKESNLGEWWSLFLGKE